jgi:hypothetical protein
MNYSSVPQKHERGTLEKIFRKSMLDDARLL